jgi:hypothetical protein
MTPRGPISQAFAGTVAATRRRTPVTSRLRYRAPPRFHSHRPMIAIPIMASKRSKLRKACSSSCMVGSAWRHEPARWGSDFPHPPD